jgi:hypothetical protein
VSQRLRFATARQVFDAFPAAREDIAAEATNDGPLVFLRALADSPTPEDAVTFCAYLLPRREAVWWACHCVRALQAARGITETEPLRLAEAWVRDPEEEMRQKALAHGLAADPARADSWVALAAGWSGGSMAAPEQPTVPPPPHMTAKAVRAAVLMAIAVIGATDRRRALKACVEAGLRFAEGGDAKVRFV